MEKTENANALCIECGSVKQSTESGLCENGHDNWLEESDDMDRFLIAAKKFKTDLAGLIYAIKNNKSFLK